MSKLNIEAIYPVSPMQQGLLFHSLYSPGSGTYFEQLSCRIEDGFEVEVFRRSWNKVIERHSILRTAFLWEGAEEPLQVVHEKVDLPWKEEDWRSLTGPELEERLQGFLEEDRQQGFEFSVAPLMRIALFRTGEASYYFVWSRHHVLFDGWCHQALIREVFTFYDAYIRGIEIELKPPRPYRDYIAWLKQQDMGKAEAFWREELRGITKATPLAWEREGGFEGGERRGEIVLLDQASSRNLESLAKRAQVTLSTVVQGAWAMVLSRFSGEDDVVFGETVSGRSAPLRGIESIVGLFINTLPVRVEVGGDQTVTSYLRRIQKRQARALEYEYSPLMEVQRWSEVPRGTPLFETVFTFQNYPVDAGLRNGGVRSALQIGEVKNFSRTNYPLLLVAFPGPGLLLKIDYDGGRFEEFGIKRLLKQITSVLVAMADDPDRRIREIGIVAQSERHQLVSEWNDTRRDWSEGRWAHEMFEDRADQMGDAMAFASEEVQLSYRELNERANQLAHYLMELGVGGEVPVALCMERGVGMVIGLMGVLKAGGAYVPMDPGYPVERLGYMVEDAEAPVLLTESEVSGKLPSSWAQWIEVDKEWEKIGRCARENTGVRVTGENLAYVIYTSGSTGRPKGVGVTHAGMRNLALAQTPVFGISAGTVVLQFASLSFDASVSECMTTLITGAKLALGGRGEVLAGDALRRLMERERVEVGTIPPSVLASVPAMENGALGTLVVAGEACSEGLVKEWGEGRRMLDAYGPTETTVCATISGELRRDEKPRIGRPIPNTRVYVVDRRGELAPEGVAGELYVGGIGLARGYWKLAALTAERFVPDGFGGENGARLYRTGDGVRWMRDGELSYLGRQDHQVKIRGYRIEVEEIESALAEHGAVRQCAVSLQETAAGEKRLVCFLVPSGKNKPSGAALREYLKSKLPEYMVPWVFIEISELPLSPNGKVDRKALAQPCPVEPTEERERPRTPVEEMVAGVWAEVLRVEGVGVTDNFFELGGHSLLATQVISRLREVLNVEVTLRALFERPTVAGLAEVVEQARRLGNQAETPPIMPVSRERELPLSYAQQRLWFVHQLEPQSPAYHIPRTVRLRGCLVILALQQSLKEIVRRHEVLRTRYEQRDSGPVQVIDELEEVETPIWDLSELSEDDRQHRARDIVGNWMGKPFNLEQGPVWRAALVRMGPEDHLLSVCTHHIASDGWSAGLMVSEFTELYEAARTGRPSPFEELTVQYADFAVWQREWLQGETLEEQLEYWRRQLDGAPVMELPTDRARSAAPRLKGSIFSFSLSAELTRQLKALSRQEGVTLFMTLLAGFKALMARHSGQYDVVLGTDVAGRDRLETERLIGFYVNQLVIRTNLSGNPSTREALGCVRETTLGAYAHQDAPFEKLVEDLSPERDLSRSPLFQVLFSLQNMPDVAGGSTSLTIAPFPQYAGAVRFDLEILLTEVGGGLEGVIGFDAELFEAPTVLRIAGHFEQLLKAMVKDPEKRIAELSLLSAAEEWQLREEWNDTESEYPNQCAHEIFESQVEKRPDSVAVSFQGESLSYWELNRRANVVAGTLARAGVGPEVAVGVVMSRGPDLLATMLGVFKANGVYVPIDPEYPEDRLRQVLTLSDSRVIVSSRRFENRLVSLIEEAGSVRRPETLVVEQLLSDPREYGNPRSQASQGNLAYIIFTSGSTGTPKGAMVEQKGMVNHLCAKESSLSLSEKDILAQTASQSFDISVWQFLAGLLGGGRVHVVADDGTRLPTELVREVIEERVTILEAVPSMLRPIVDLLEVGTARAEWALRVAVATGEVLEAGLCRRWARVCPDIPLVNAYGPTECSDDVTQEIVDRRLVEQWTRIAIGRSLINTRTYVVDADGGLAPLGVEGELLVGGYGVGRGYYRDSARTAECFVPDERARERGARAYLTGDRSRQRNDGRIDFLGRIDGQVKLRGYRVELGEVEGAVTAHPEVEEAVVAVRENGSGGQALVGYLVLRSGAKVVATELRRFLRESLPDYMVPTAFVMLDRMPLSPNGKVDRKKLPAPELQETPGDDEAPRTPLERTLAEIWAGVLRTGKVGVRQNFFELGGDSILSMQVVGRAQHSGISISPRQIFQHQTIAELAEAVSASELVQAPQGVVTGPVPLTPVQARFFEQGRVHVDHFNQSLFLEGNRHVSPEQLERLISTLRSHHDALRMRFWRESGRWKQNNTDDVEADALIWIDLSGLEERAQGRALRQAAAGLQASLDLERGLVLRVGCFWLGLDQPQRLLLVAHHLIVDTLSWTILLEDLEHILGKLTEGEPVWLAPKTTSYQQWAEALVEHRTSAGAQREADFWEATAREPIAPLPRDRWGGENTVASEGRVLVEMSEGETEHLVRDAPKAYDSEVHEVLIASLARSVTEWSRDRGMLVDLEGHGREEEIGVVDLSRTVGWFTSIYPIWIPRVEGGSPRSQLERVRDRMRAVPRRGIGYAILRYLDADSAIARLLAQSPRAEIGFTYLGRLDPAVGSERFFRPAAAPSGGQQSGQDKREWPLEVTCWISQGRFHSVWSYSRNLHRSATVERLAQDFLAALRDFIALSVTPAEEPRETKIDVLGFDVKELDAILTGIRAARS